MKSITFYFDPISPYAYLAFERLPQALEGISHHVVYKPILFAGLLKHHGQLGPAEIAPKREWTYRQVAWLGHALDIGIDMPAAHPFNPLPLLRLAVASSSNGQPNRYVCEQIFRHVWRGGFDAADAARLQALTEQLKPQRDPSSDAVKDELKANTQQAIQSGLFGVPTFGVDDKLFWGLDALPMLRAHLQQDPWFDTMAWDAAARLPGQQRAQIKPVGGSLQKSL
jgi:2-hydroxychromene-2-carboxylate isomerase